ncbi:MAG: SpoIIE family protein phosphatase [Pirellulales bacterium]|nr:SpoIIE family protein phosphatase [Pirellulales bacterium]
MAPSASTTLKLYTERAPSPVRPPIETIGSLPEVLRAFQSTTGWSLRYETEEAGNPIGASGSKKASKERWFASLAPGMGSSAGRLSLESLDTSNPPKKRPSVEFEAARGMASSIAGMVRELMQTRHALWRREADLAAGVPLLPHRENEDHLAERLQASVKAAAFAVEGQAAALYLLDEGTSELKLRSCWGLPFDRFAAPARRLQGSLADLEAMLGHAVVLENTALMPGWNAPEDFAAAVCVPVSSSTTILGTLWVFCDETRDFTDRQTNVVELAAGKIASDLEREMLLREGVESAQYRKQWAAAERMQKNQLPTVSPLLDGWQIAGWAAQAQGLGGTFYDWFCLPDGLLACALGESLDRGLESALSAAAVKAALRAHAAYHREAQRVLQRLNLTIWTNSAGDQYANVFLGLLETATGRICCSTAGRPSIVHLTPDRWISLTGRTPLLGESPESEFEQAGYELAVGESLVICSKGFREAADNGGCRLEEAGLARLLAENTHLTANQLCAMARECLHLHAENPRQDDVAVLVIKRTT